MNDDLLDMLSSLQNKYWGKYRGFVEDSHDPEKLGRLRLRIPSVLGNEITAWALPCLPYGGMADIGLYAIPPAGAQVWVEFEGGQTAHPIWTGTFWQQESDVPSEVQPEPTTFLFKTAKGSKWVIEDKDDEEMVRLEHTTGANLNMNADGTIELTDGNGAQIQMDADRDSITISDANGNTISLTTSGTTVEDKNGNTLEMTGSGITIQGQQIMVEANQVLLGGTGGEPVIKGQSFLTLFATHVHTCTAPGSPTTPPIPQGEAMTLSMNVMTK